jgi:hypothetical protein
LRSSPRQSRPHTFHDHSALKLREATTHLEESFASRGGGIDTLLMQVEVNVLGVDL